MVQETEFGTVCEVISSPGQRAQGRFLFAYVRDVTAFAASQDVQDAVCYSVDAELLYEPFYADFGPLNLGHAYKFCRRTAELVQEAARLGKTLLFYTGPNPQHKANAAVLVGIFQVMLLGRSAAVAHGVLRGMEPLLPFRDASSGVPCFLLRVQHVLAGVERAKAAGFLDWDSPRCTFDLAEYEHYEQVENGDLNWIVPGKLLAFSGPSPVARVYYGFKSFTPEDYWQYFRARGVSAVVRLNKQMYEGRRFVAGGFRQHELYFPDGSCPSEAILQRFLAIVEAEPGALAVHCKAGLGRTGVLICAYLIKHHGFSAEEAIGYIRVCRPGSVIGPQQTFLLAHAPRLAAEGAAARAAAGRRAAPAAGAAWALRPPAGDAGGLSKPAQASAARAVFSLTASSSGGAPPAPRPPAQAPGAPGASRKEPGAPPVAGGAAAGAAADAAVAAAAAAAAAAAVAAAAPPAEPAPPGEPGGAVPAGGTLRPFPAAAAAAAPAVASAAAAAAASARRPSLPALAALCRPGALPGGGKAPGRAVARALAPNGQPRKLPAALLGAPAELAAYARASGEEGGAACGARERAGASAGWTISATMRSLAGMQR